MGLATLDANSGDIETEWRRIEDEEKDIRPLKRTLLCP